MSDLEAAPTTENETALDVDELAAVAAVLNSANHYDLLSILYMVDPEVVARIPWAISNLPGERGDALRFPQVATVRCTCTDDVCLEGDCPACVQRDGDGSCFDGLRVEVNTVHESYTEMVGRMDDAEVLRNEMNTAQVPDPLVATAAGLRRASTVYPHVMSHGTAGPPPQIPVFTDEDDVAAQIESLTTEWEPMP